MKISVIIPCFNEEDYLDNCLSTLATQTRPPDEVIVCDNNSTDKSVNIANKYSKALPLKVIKQPIKGIIPTVEKAWKSTSGELIVRTDADASFPKKWLENIEKHFLSDSALAACGGNWIPYPVKFKYTLLTQISLGFGDIVFPLFRGFKMLYGLNTAFRRSTLAQINGYTTKQIGVIDDQLVSQKLALAKLKYCRFSNCWNYHSSRRLQRGLPEMIRVVASSIFPTLYQEKST